MESVLGIYFYAMAKDWDIHEALAYAAWRVEEIDIPLISVSG